MLNRPLNSDDLYGEGHGGDYINPNDISTKSAASSMSRSSRSSSSWLRSCCTCRNITNLLLTIMIGMGIGAGITLGYHHFIHPIGGNRNSNDSTTIYQWTDPNMERFWVEKNLPYQLYYNHSTLSNTTLFPRASRVSWGGLNSYRAQTELVERVIWIIDQLLNVSQPHERIMVWQEERVQYLKVLHRVYQLKLAKINGDGIAVGMIPKWYESMVYGDTWWDTMPSTGSSTSTTTQYVWGSDLEGDYMFPVNNGQTLERGAGVIWSRQSLYHFSVGKSQIVTAGGSRNDSDPLTGRSRIVTRIYGDSDIMVLFNMLFVARLIIDR
jgi:hypothetical protein